MLGQWTDPTRDRKSPEHHKTYRRVIDSRFFPETRWPVPASEEEVAN
jgi:hypothetical protein